MTASKSQHRTVIPFLVLPLLMLTCCGEEPETPKAKRLPIEGTWFISSADQDGVPAFEWENHYLSFFQLTADSGRYNFPTAPYDSIFPKSGGWEMIDSIAFRRSDGAKLYFFKSHEDALSMLLVADWLLAPDPCVEDSLCNGIVAMGLWAFDLRRTEKTD